MAPLTPAGAPGRTLADDEWVAVDDGAMVATARRRAAALAKAVGLGEVRVSEVEIVASELATNLVKHARGGDLVLRPIPGGVQLVAVDAGPGSRDLEALIGAGRSTAGTLGLGLGAVRRLSSRLEMWSEPGRGAVVVADLEDLAGPGSGAPAEPPVEPRVGSLLRPLRGETVCGDAVAVRPTATGWLLMMADGLGHGPLAARASSAAAAVLESDPSTAPADLVRRMHLALGGTRGAAVAVSHVDLADRVLTHAAVGNISGRLLGADRRSRSLVTQPGIVGYRLPRVQETRYDLDDAQLVVLHSDGLTEKWHESALPVATRHRAVVCAALLVRDAGTCRDDAGVLTFAVGP